MLNTLGDHLQIVWGLLLAASIVVLLTPAVGGMARLLGVVDRPEGRRLNRRTVPRLGAALGFLRHNLYPARIFMGDSGALLLGFVLAAVPLQGLLKTASIVTLFFPLVVLAVPIIDTSFVVAKRLKYRQPVYAPDRHHLHHRFVNIGFSQRRAAGAMWGGGATPAPAAPGARVVPFPE